MNYSFGRNAADKPLQKTLSFGAYPAVSLADARARRDVAKQLLAQKRDPAVVWREADSARAVADRQTFKVIAEAWFELNSGWSLVRKREWGDRHDRTWKIDDASHWTNNPSARWTAVHSRDVVNRPGFSGGCFV